MSFNQKLTISFVKWRFKVLEACLNKVSFDFDSKLLLFEMKSYFIFYLLYIFFNSLQP